jgi:hypothetical protein
MLRRPLQSSSGFAALISQEKVQPLFGIVEFSDRRSKQHNRRRLRKAFFYPRKKSFDGSDDREGREFALVKKLSTLFGSI